MIHVSEMSWTKRVKHPSKILNAGDWVECVVLDIDQEGRRLSLGLKQTEPNPWDLIDTKYRVGDIIHGKVRNITDFGAFVEVEEGIDGLVHISDLSWTRRIKHPGEVLKKGDDVEAVILKIDSENQRLSLGIKQLQPNVLEDFFRSHGVGDVLTGKIVRLTEFGAFVELFEGVEGLVHVSEMSKDRIENPEEHFAVGSGSPRQDHQDGPRREEDRAVDQGRARRAGGQLVATRTSRASRATAAPRWVMSCGDDVLRDEGDLGAED